MMVSRFLQNISKRSIILGLLFAIFAIAGQEAFAQLTARQVAQKAASVISSSKGLAAGFTLTANGQTSKGTIKSSGSKFSVLLPQVSSWYDGKALYTYNPRTSETTIIEPTAQEMLESNPLLYVKGGGNGFNYSFSKIQKNGKYVVELLPRNKRSGLKKLIFTTNKSTFHPEKIEIDGGGMTSVVNVTSFKTGVSLPAGAFAYPRSKYPNVEIVDLR